MPARARYVWSKSELARQTCCEQLGVDMVVLRSASAQPGPFKMEAKSAIAVQAMISTDLDCCNSKPIAAAKFLFQAAYHNNLRGLWHQLQSSLICPSSLYRLALQDEGIPRGFQQGCLSLHSPRSLFLPQGLLKQLMCSGILLLLHFKSCPGLQQQLTLANEFAEAAHYSGILLLLCLEFCPDLQQ